MADHDILTIDEAKRALQIEVGDSKWDATLAPYITAVSELFDQEFGFFVRRTVQGERHDGGRARIFLRQRPVFEITTVVEHQQSTTGITLSAEAPGSTAANAYLAEFYEPEPTLYSGTIIRRAGGCDWRFWHGRQNIVVDYEPGRYENTGAVPDRAKRAAGVTLVNLWRDQGPSIDNDGEIVIPFASFPGFAIPNVAKELMSREHGTDAPWGYA